MKHFALGTLFLCIIFFPVTAEDLFSPKTEESVRKLLIKEGFPSDLLKNYSIKPTQLPQLLRLLAIYNGYKDKHDINIKYDSKEQEWLLVFSGHPSLYWANGRLLPQSELKNLSSYRAYISYQWSEVASDMRDWPWERLQRFQKSTSPEVQRTQTTYQGLYHHLLYHGSNQHEIEQQLVEITFLGTNIRIHQMVAPALQRVNDTIVKASLQDPSLKEFLQTLTSPSSYYWRNIAGSNSISYHSYGIAVDINPKKTIYPIYWLWERARNAQWFLVAPEDRWQIHPTILQAFFDEGFLWGGSWPQYDIMHFEYRPELKELARLNQLFSSYLPTR